MLANLILPSGISKLDKLLARGIHTGLITHIYGIAGSGKTTVALVFVKEVLNMGMRVLYINSEASTPIERLKQITGTPFENIADRITLLLPKSFEEQSVMVEDLVLYVKEDTRLIVMDTMTRLYRAALEGREANYAIHRELNRQMGFLKGVATQKDIAIIVLNQVRAKMDEPYEIEPVAKSIMDYWSDYTICIHGGRKSGERDFERLRPEGGKTKETLYIVAEGLVAERPQEKQ